MTSSNENLTEILLKINKDLSSGLLYAHTRINANTTKNLEAASFLMRLSNFSMRKGFSQ